MSVSSTAEKLVSISQTYAICVGIFLLSIGLIATILNLFVFISSKTLRNNQYAFYIIIETITNILQLLILLVSRTVMDGSGFDLTQSSVAWCKIRAVLTQALQLIYIITICLATFDQFLSTSNRPLLRQMSTIKLAYRSMFINICFTTIHSIPFLIFFNIQPLVGCLPNNLIFLRYYSSFYYPILIGLFPLCFMFVFSMLAFRNVRRIIRRQALGRRRLDRQFTSMILARVTGVIICSLPYVINRIYTLNDDTSQDDALDSAIKKCIQEMTTSIFYINYAGGLYIYLASSSRFRRQVKYVLMKKCWRSFTKNLIRKNQNRIVPIAAVSSGVSREAD